jgi:hypothetical protein
MVSFCVLRKDKVQDFLASKVRIDMTLSPILKADGLLRMASYGCPRLAQ